MDDHPGAGIYVHIPFCAQRCHYCDFNTYAGMDDLAPRYVSGLRAEIRAVAEAGPEAVRPPGRQATPPPQWPIFHSVFVGGGTPTLLPADDLARVIDDLRTHLPVAHDAEITVEANPETVTVEHIGVLAAAGVNRVSMGAQSFAPHVLEALGRWHDVDRPRTAVAAVREAGVSRINLDLIYGTPGERDEDWHASLQAALDTGTSHVSAYALTVEPNTEYARRIRAGTALAPDDDVQADRMAVADEILSDAGLARYELSNWAHPGHECRHNLVYWGDGDWLGFGAGAHGHWSGRRWWNLRAPARYTDAALAGASVVGGDEVPSASERRTERLLMGLRRTDGVAMETVAPLDDGAVGRLVAAGLLTVRSGRLRLTREGFKVANGVTVALL